MLCVWCAEQYSLNRIELFMIVRKQVNQCLGAQTLVKMEACVLRSRITESVILPLLIPDLLLKRNKIMSE